MDAFHPDGCAVCPGKPRIRNQSGFFTAKAGIFSAPTIEAERCPMSEGDTWSEAINEFERFVSLVYISGREPGIFTKTVQ